MTLNDSNRIRWLAERHSEDEPPQPLSRAWLYLGVMLAFGWAANIYNWAVLKFEKALRGEK